MLKTNTNKTMLMSSENIMIWNQKKSKSEMEYFESFLYSVVYIETGVIYVYCGDSSQLKFTNIVPTDIRVPITWCEN